MTDSTTHPIDYLNAFAALPDPNSDIYIAIRSLLIDPQLDDSEFADLAPYARNLFPTIAQLIHDIDELATTEYHSDDLQRRSMLLLDYSLCPIHRCDYAICFDDDDADCAQIRAFFPSHDT